ncbi:cytochrome [Spirillospora sp. NPDC029432]|uniref:cytochrome n=1 Tax=Spirillospora sp. NPDC029432 TaxID=3154599 RepID=UPI003451391A
MIMRLAGAGSTEPSLESLAAEPMLTREFETAPADFYRRLREEYGPVAPVDLLGVPVWLVVGYPQSLEILRDRQGQWNKNTASWRAWADGKVPADWPVRAAFANDCVLMQDGWHADRLRNAWATGLKPFQNRTSPQARRLEKEITGYADELITLLAEGTSRTGHADLAAQYARPLPLMVLNRLVGFDDGRGDDLLMDLWRIVDAGPDSAEAMVRIHAALEETITSRQANPGEDLTSYMIAADPTLTVEELCKELTLAVAMLSDFCGTLIASTIAEVIAGDPAARDSLSAGMLQETVNRVSMANPPEANLSFRFARSDVRMGRYTIASGDAVCVSVAAAHTDPIFTDNLNADSVTSSRAHLAWSTGPHGCMGRELATTLTTIAIGRLFDRFSGLRLALPTDQLPWRSSPFMRGLRSLPVEYELAGPPPPPRTAAPADSPAEPALDPRPQQPGRLRRILRNLRKEQL